ncbi:hypothetical protein INT80_05425 [Gallibacterium anatis]|uniref:Uncharacterized protein n=1 Tax=Gallibacterium anatis TaxID=750 RepID=A0A930UVW2_9PAST|nr:hypothetical protein [Gallibacterium anatis]
MASWMIKDKYFLPFGWVQVEFSPEQENYDLLSIVIKKSGNRVKKTKSK